MRFMLTPRLIFGVAALLATDVALASGDNPPEDVRYAGVAYSASELDLHAPSASLEKAASNEEEDRKLEETGTGEDGDENKSSDDTKIGDTTSGSE